MGGYALSVPAFEEEYIYRLRFSRNRYQDFFIGAYAKLYCLKNLSPSIANYRLGLGKRLGFMSGLTLLAAVARGRHRKPTPNHAECLIVIL